ncbi:CAP domain-containing protein [Paenibacillus sp. SC116]|uniref:CAP domain-containing protein n=1 Tax=Paenibacillus sp. SC116 TaxID=2968986 RepID=UPI00215B4D24|nr:CAP domain-containing protein [Paenibacillus sp. SC116]MCR8844904.1 CAP domain-containing protein [Paenibacillus sp. SC116]
MKKPFKHVHKLVVVGALALTPVLSVGTAAAAPECPAPTANTNVKGQTIVVNGNSMTDLNELLSKWFPNWNIVVNKPEANKPKPQPQPEKPKPQPEKPKPQPEKPSKPETKPEQPTKPTTPTKPENNNGNQGTQASTNVQQVVELVNKERAKAGLPALKYDEKLSQVAHLKAKDMIDNNYFDHNSPTYGSPFDMMRSQGVSYNTAGENIAKGQRSAEEVMKDWMNSPGHRQNILKDGYTKIGVGYYNGAWVQMFIG